MKYMLTKNIIKELKAELELTENELINESISRYSNWYYYMEGEIEGLKKALNLINSNEAIYLSTKEYKEAIRQSNMFAMEIKKYWKEKTD